MAKDVSATTEAVETTISFGTERSTDHPESVTVTPTIMETVSEPEAWMGWGQQKALPLKDPRSSRRSENRSGWRHQTAGTIQWVSIATQLVYLPLRFDANLIEKTLGKFGATEFQFTSTYYVCNHAQGC